MKFNVRCCCIPKIVLGVLELPDKVQSKPQRVIVPMMEKPYAELYTGGDHEPSKYSPVMIELKRFFDYDVLSGIRHEEVAIVSDERPVEFWRGFGNAFEEGKELPRGDVCERT